MLFRIFVLSWTFTKINKNRKTFWLLYNLNTEILGKPSKLIKVTPFHGTEKSFSVASYMQIISSFICQSGKTLS